MTFRDCSSHDGGSPYERLVSKLSPQSHAKSFTVNRVKSRDFARDRFVAMLRTAFPADNEIGIDLALAGKTLSTDPRTVRMWANQENTPSFDHVVAVGAIIGIWKTMKIMSLDQTKETVQGWIGRS